MTEIVSACSSDNIPDLPVATIHGGQRLISIMFGRIRAFANHPFRIYEGERLTDMVESIRQNGILMPLIVRRIYDEPDYDYEMLSGHNRMNAATIAGLSEALSVVKEGISDVEALMYVIETNLMQRSFTDLLPSEKAAVLALRYSEMFSQGKRSDIIRELHLLENPNAEDGATCGTECHKLNRESLGSEYALAGRAVADYLRIDKLIVSLKARLDDNGMTLKAGVALSFLDKESQCAVEEALLAYKGKLSERQGQLLRQAATPDGLTSTTALRILNGIQSKPATSLRIKQAVYAPYFQADTPPKEIERIVGEALKLYFSQSSVGESA